MTTPPKNFIHPTAIVGSQVVMGEGNYVGPFCLIEGKTVLGNHNRFEAYCSIGTPPEHKDYFTYADGEVRIGDGNVFREFVTVNAGMSHPTVLGNRNSLLRNSHVGHDSILEDDIILACNVLIGGHSYLMSGCYFGLASMCHQYSLIGGYSMIGMGGVVPKKRQVHPGHIFVGNPVEFLKENSVGLQRSGLSDSDIVTLRVRYTALQEARHSLGGSK